jgi:putative DNA primase/helicase
VIVGEGEKTADAIETLFPNCVATTSPGGGKAPGFTDWTPLSGRHVLIWPDFDHPGMSYAARVAYCAHQVGALSVRLIDFPWWGLPQEIGDAWRLVARNAPVPDGHDADDAIKEGWTPELARTLLPEHARLITVMSV